MPVTSCATSCCSSGAWCDGRFALLTSITVLTRRSTTSAQRGRNTGCGVGPGAVAGTLIWFPTTLAFGWYANRASPTTPMFYGSFGAGIATSGLALYHRIQRSGRSRAERSSLSRPPGPDDRANVLRTRERINVKEPVTARASQRIPSARLGFIGLGSPGRFEFKRPCTIEAVVSPQCLSVRLEKAAVENRASIQGR